MIASFPASRLDSAPARPHRSIPLQLVQWFVASLVVLGMAGTASAQLRLNEIQVVNLAGEKDEDGTFQPWVELWNASQIAKVQLNNLKLTDGTTTWVFPAVDIMPDEHMIIWLSGKDRRVATTPLHANFSPPATGGSISLLNATDVLVSKLDFPAQAANTSWGRDASDIAVTPTVTGVYTVPTPNEPNNYVGAGVAGAVSFGQTSRAFTGTMEVTLAQTTPVVGAEIYYTVTSKLPSIPATTPPPSTLPSETSTRYTGPITLEATSMIRARVIQSGKLPGQTGAEGFLQLAANAEGFTSTMPIVVISNFGRGTPPDPIPPSQPPQPPGTSFVYGDQQSFMWIWEPVSPGSLARFSNPPTLATRTAIERRGSSTSGDPKSNLNVETRTAWNEAQSEFPLLGMPTESDWVFHAPYNFDRSLIHNPLAYALSNSIGRYASRTRLAEVFLDVNGTSLNNPGTNTGAADYYGVYNVMEKVRRGQDRVDIRKLEKYDNDAVSKTGGWIWKVDRTDPGDGGFSAGGQSFAWYTPKELEVRSPQRDPQEQFLAKNSNPTVANPLPAGFIKRFADALKEPTFTDPVLGYAPFLDVPPAIDHHLHNVWTFNVDALRLSGYWTKERGGKMFPGPVWDFDRALCSTDGRDLDPKTWRSKVPDNGTDFFNFTWWNRLFRDPDFYQKYIDRWQALRRPGQPFSAPVVNALIDSINAQISNEAVTRDYNRWRQAKRVWKSPFTGTNYPAPLADQVQGQVAEIQRIKDWMQQRADFIDTQWVGAVTASLADGNVAAGTQVTLTGPADATIYYTINGTDPRSAGGAVVANVPALSAGTRVYDGPLTVNATSRIRARAFKPTHTALTGANNPPLVSKWGGLLNVRYATDPLASAGTLVVSEINFHPADPTPAELAVNPLWDADDFEFVELHNPGPVAIDLFGVSVADAVTFTISGEAAISLAPGGSAIIADDPAAIAARYGSSIGPVLGPYGGNLSNGGELISLQSSGGAGIFSVNYDDGWFPAADGGGSSMVAYDPQALTPAFNSIQNWRLSAAAGGSPAAYDPRSAPRPNGGDAPAGPFTALPLPAVLEGGLGGTAAPTFQWTFREGPGTGTITPATSLVATAAFSMPGAYTLRLTASDGLLTRTDDVVVYAQETPASWLTGYPGIGTLDDDAEGDGRTNFHEYALQTNPTTPDAGAPPVVDFENGRPSLTFTRLAPSSAVVYATQVSEDLVTWRLTNPGEITEEILATTGFTQTVRLTDTVPAVAGAPRYLRLRMTAAP